MIKAMATMELRKAALWKDISQLGPHVAYGMRAHRRRVHFCHSCM
jgi:hypothetical protein